MRNRIRKTLCDSRVIAFEAGMAVGIGVTLFVLKDRVFLDHSAITLSAPQAVLDWLAESGHVAEFPNKVGTFVLQPPIR
jgi:hypothetical protein